MHNQNRRNLQVAVAFAGGFFVTATLIGIRRYFRKKEGSGKRSTTSREITTTAINIDSRTETGAPRFPWEPMATNANQTSSLLSTSTLTTDNAAARLSLSAAQERLQFLSQMTFANGGIRTPSCVCCL